LKDDIVMVIEEIEWEVVDWVHFGGDRIYWWALVNMVMSLQFPYKEEISFLA
jgi:hypothetical protein